MANERRVFFSWQSDTAPELGRYLIRDALKRACKALSAESDELVRPDSGSEGIAGIQEIQTTILEKLRTTDVAIFDVTPVARSPQGKAIPNPNVMFELGYMLREAHNNIALTMNTAQSKIEELPFDIRQRPVITYTCNTDEDRKKAQTNLEVSLTSAIRTLLSQQQQSKTDSELDRTIELIKQHQPSAVAEVKERASEIYNAMIALSPPDPFSHEKVREALRSTAPLQSQTIALARACLRASHGDAFMSFATTLLRELIVAARLDLYDRAARPVELARLLARETFLIFVATCVQEDQWEQLYALIAHEFEYTDVDHLQKSALFFRTWMYPEIMKSEYAPYCTLMQERFAPGGEISEMSFADLRSAEALIAVVQQHTKQPNDATSWIPYMMVVSSTPPAAISNVTSAVTARKIARLLQTNRAGLAVTYERLFNTLEKTFERTQWSWSARHTWPGADEIPSF